LHQFDRYLERTVKKSEAARWTLHFLDEAHHVWQQWVADARLIIERPSQK